MPDETTTPASGTVAQPAAAGDSAPPAASAAPTDLNADPKINIDLSVYPKELQEKFQAEFDRINGEIKSNYTKKHQDLATERARIAEERERSAAEVAEFKRVAREVLADTTNAKLMEYRKQLGYHKEEAPSEPEYSLPENPTVGDLINLMKTMVDHKVSGVRQYADQRTNESLQDYERKLRWEDAERELRKDPVGDLYADEISYAAVKVDKYRKMYQSGASEHQVLKAVLEDFKSKRNKDLDSVKQNWLSEMSKKKGDTTLEPTPGTGGLTSDSKPKTKEQMVQELAAKFGLRS